jgi:5-methylcytosine-specific restriction endonuclease McrA
MKKKICNHPGCNELIEPTERYCPQHKKEQPKPFSSAIRFNEKLYKTTQWKQLRKKILKEQPACFKCGSTNNLQIHHIIPPLGNEELFFNENNLVVVCLACHQIITNKEIRKRNES